MRPDVVEGLIDAIDDEIMRAAADAPEGTAAADAVGQDKRAATKVAETDNSIVSRLVQLAALAGTLGAVTYGALRGAYGLFYSKYRVAPEELGFSQVEVLSRSATAIFLVAVPALIATAIWLGRTKDTQQADRQSSGKATVAEQARSNGSGRSETEKGKPWSESGIAGLVLCMTVMVTTFFLRGFIVLAPSPIVSRVVVVGAFAVAVLAAFAARVGSNSRRRSLLLVAALVFPSMWIGWIYGTSYSHEPAPYAPPSEVVNPNVFIRSVCFTTRSAGEDSGCVDGLLLAATERDYFIYLGGADCATSESCVSVLSRSEVLIRFDEDLHLGSGR